MAEEESRRRLGRGLAALIGDMDQVSNGASSERDDGISADRLVAIEYIRANPNNPRRIFAEHELADLTNSIREHGIVQPLLVRPIKGEDLGGAKYEIIAGERRWRAAQRAQVHEVPVVIRDVEDRQALELAIIENVQRADLNPLEEAMGYQQLIDEYDYSQADLGDVIGKSRSHVANTLRLLKLPMEVQSLVTEGQLSAGHARTLITAANPQEIAQKIMKQGLSVRQAEALAQKSNAGGSDSSGKNIKLKDADLLALEKQLSDALGMKTTINYANSGKGDLKIAFKSLDQLDYLCNRLSRNAI